MDTEKENEILNPEPPPATPDIIEEGLDGKEDKPEPATQDILKYTQNAGDKSES
jgi:hypothetical protein